MAEGEVKEYHIQASEIVRRYLEGRYEVSALELTSYEVLERLRALDLGEETLVALGGFLEDCDLVKFAKHVPTDQSCAQLVLRARTLVRETMWAPLPVSSSQATADMPDEGTQGEGSEPVKVTSGAGEGQ